MIRFTDFLEEKGYIKATSNRIVSYYKHSSSSNSDIWISRKKIEIYITIGEDLTTNRYFLLRKPLQDYFAPYNISSMYRVRRSLVVARELNITNSYISNVAAKKIETILKPFDNEENLQKICDDIRELVSKAAAGDEDIKEVKDYNDMESFIKSKGLELNEWSLSSIAKEFTVGSYNYKLSISSLLYTPLEIKIELKDSTYFDELSKLYPSADSNFLYNVQKIWYSNYFHKFKTSLLSPLECNIYFLGTGVSPSIDSTDIIIYPSQRYDTWNNEERLELIKDYINVFSDTSSAKEFLDLVGELIIESIGNEL